MIAEDIFMLIMTWLYNQSDQMHCWLIPIIIAVLMLLVVIIVTRLTYQKLKGTAGFIELDRSSSLQGHQRLIIQELKVEDIDDEDFELEENNDSGLGGSASKNSSATSFESMAGRNTTRWQNLIEEGQVLNQRIIRADPKEWIRTRRILLGVNVPNSPMTKHLLHWRAKK